MKLKIHSIQKFDSHIEEVKESHDCEISQKDKTTYILYSRGRFVLDENSVIIENGDNVLHIIKGETTNLTYRTEHGIIEMRINGISIDAKWEDDFLNSVRLVYEIAVGENTPYVNDIRLSIIRKNA